MDRFFRPMEECLYTSAPTGSTSASLCMRVSTTRRHHETIVHTSSARGRTGRDRNAIRACRRWSKGTDGFPAWIPCEFDARDEGAQQHWAPDRRPPHLREFG